MVVIKGNKRIYVSQSLQLVGKTGKGQSHMNRPYSEDINVYENVLRRTINRMLYPKRLR